MHKLPTLPQKIFFLHFPNRYYENYLTQCHKGTLHTTERRFNLTPTEVAPALHSYYIYLKSYTMFYIKYIYYINYQYKIYKYIKYKMMYIKSFQPPFFHQNFKWQKNTTINPSKYIKPKAVLTDTW